jgi:hypothetical protein
VIFNIILIQHKTIKFHIVANHAFYLSFKTILSQRFNPIKSNVNELAEFLGVSPLKIIKQKVKK